MEEDKVDLQAILKPELAHFQAIPWCAALLNDPQYVVEPTYRRIKRDGEDALVGHTLRTDKTISGFISFWKKLASEAEMIPEVHSLVSLECGLDGYPRVLHGGIVATLLDEIMGVALTVNKNLEIERE